MRRTYVLFEQAGSVSGAYGTSRSYDNTHTMGRAGKNSSTAVDTHVALSGRNYDGATSDAWKYQEYRW